jgi:hypothetical protein
MWEAKSLLHVTITGGRWLQTYVDMVNGLPFMPWVMGLVCLSFMSLIAAILVHLLNIKRRLYALLIALAMVSFPAVATSLAYHCTSAHIALLMAVLSVYFTRRLRFGFLIGALLIMLSLAIYQAYIFAASALFVILMVLKLLDGKETVKHTFIGGVKALLALGIGYVAYTLILNCVLRYTGLELSSYKGINQMNTLGLDDLWHSLDVIYGTYLNVFDRSHDRMFAPIMPWVILITGGLTAIALIWFVAKKYLWRQPLKLGFILLLLIMIPVATNGIYIVSVLGATVHELMIMPRVMSSVFCIALLARFDETLKNLRTVKPSSRCPIAIICWLQIVFLTIAFYGNFLNINEAYMKHDLAIRQATVFTEGLYRDILATPNYTEGMPIYRIGQYNSPLTIPPEYDIRTNTIFGFLTKGEIINTYSYASFTATYIGDNLNFVPYMDDEMLMPYEDIIDKMPIYPADGSIRVVDDIVLLKFGEL